MQYMKIHTCGHLLRKMASLCPSSCARLCKIPVVSTHPLSVNKYLITWQGTQPLSPGQCLVTWLSWVPLVSGVSHSLVMQAWSIEVHAVGPELCMDKGKRPCSGTPRETANYGRHCIRTQQLDHDLPSQIAAAKWVMQEDVSTVAELAACW